MATADRPNLLFVFSDQHRWCDLGCYGNPEVRTPNFDRFAASALRFTRCISNSPLCVPARGTMMTGLMPLRHGAFTNDLPMRPGVTSIADVLGRAGYHTGYIGKWHLAGVPRDQAIPPGERRFGFREWKVCNCNHRYLNAYYYDEDGRRIDIEGYEPVAQTDLAVDFITRNRGPRPWFLALSWGPPHDPYDQVPASFLNEYAGRELALRPNVPEVVHPNLRRTIGKPQVLEMLRGYYAHITALDEQFGRLIEALENTGQLANTVVVYTSDHGDMLGSQGYTNKQLPFEESIRVPLLVRWDGAIPAATTDELIGLVDLPVSLAGLLGLEFPGEVDGMDLHRTFLDPAQPTRESCYIFDLVPCHQAAARGGTEWRGLRTRRYTFARTARDEGFMLYDNETDPFQMRNLIDDPAYAEVRARLREELDRYIRRHDALLPWDRLIVEYGFRDAWNESQAYFGLPLL